MRLALNAVARRLTGGAVRDARWINWGSLTVSHVATLRQGLVRDYSPAYVHLMLAALKGVLGSAYDLEQLDTEPWLRIQSVLKQRVGARALPAGRTLSREEVARVWVAAAVDKSPLGRRNAVILALLRLGLRRAEVVSVDLGNVNFEAKTLRVAGKGRVERLAYFSDSIVQILRAWVRVRGDWPGPLVCPVRTPRARRRLLGSVVPYVLHELCERAGIGPCTPHDWRRTFATDLLREGVPIDIAAKLMGHKAISTTIQHYVRRLDDDLRDAASKLKIPD